MALQKNKVKFGLNKVHWAKITAWSDDGVPNFATPVRLPGAVSLSIDANGENENFYADNSVYYVINNNAGYDGDLEVALITTDFATAILGEQLDAKGVLVERNDAESRVEEVLTQHNIYYTKTESYIESEKLYEVLYEMEV